MKDAEGWPIMPGARVRVEYSEIMTRSHAVGCLRLGCGCPSYPAVRHGKVRRCVEAPPSGRPYVEVVEFDSFNTLTPAPCSVRVMRGATAASKRHEILTVEGLNAYKKRVSR